MPSPHRVLFVEDYPPFKRSFARLLTRQFGLAVTVAESGEEAIGLFGTISPELVILDLGLPGVDGTETLQVIRALPGGESVPVIVLTGSNDPEWRRAAAELHIKGYILKENANEEFSAHLLSIFPDLVQTIEDCANAVAGSVMLTDAPESAGRKLAQVPCARRSVRVLVPREMDAPQRSDRWARRLVHRATAAFPRLFGGGS